LFFAVTRSPVISTLSLHDALPICWYGIQRIRHAPGTRRAVDAPLLDSSCRSSVLATCDSDPSSDRGRYFGMLRLSGEESWPGKGDRKSTRLNSSHVAISYAVFCLK